MDPTDVKAWKEDVLALRKEKDGYFGEDGSPLPDDERKSFQGLKYFEPNPDFHVEAKVERLSGEKPFTMEVSQGRARPMVRSALLKFELKGQPLVLEAYQDAGKRHADQLFIPFRDATSGKESYGAGRYLDIDDLGGDTVTLDFNVAYSPYCAYSDQFSCPLPPKQNWLPVKIEAGEKSFHPDA